MATPTDAAAGLVQIERRGRVVFVTMTRPEAANALSKALAAVPEITLTATLVK